MSALPWVRFFPSDWLAGTRGLSAAETGVYITLIMMMYDRGGPLTDDAPRLARLCGSQVNHFNSALAALIEQGKIYRTEDGALFNHRVRQEGESGRDFASLQSARRKSGWEKKAKENNDGTLPDDNRKPTENIPYHNQKPEKIIGLSPDTRAREPDPFLAFWAKYPNKTGKPKALAAYRSALKRATADEIAAGLDRYIASKPPDRQWMNPATFLNQDRWGDEPAIVDRPATGPPRHGPLGEMLRDIAQRQNHEPDFDLDLSAIAH